MDEEREECERGGALWARPVPGDRPESPVAESWRQPTAQTRLAAPERGRPGGAVLERFEPLHGRASAARVGFVLVAAIAAVGIVGDVLELRLLDRIAAGGVVTAAEADANDSRQGLIGLLYTLAYLTAAVLFLRWFNLAYRGVDALGGVRRYHTGWSIGGWFVPILSLWRPKEIANDLWATARAEDEPERSPLLLAWWVGFLLSGILGNIITRSLIRDDGTLEATRRIDEIDIAASVVDIVGVVLALAVVSAITTRLHRRAGVPPG